MLRDGGAEDICGPCDCDGVDWVCCCDTGNADGGGIECDGSHLICCGGVGEFTCGAAGAMLSGPGDGPLGGGMLVAEV